MQEEESKSKKRKAETFEEDLQWATSNGRNDIVKRLVEEKGYDVNKEFEHGGYLLEFAIIGQQPSTVKLLLELGADPNASDGPETAIWHAVVNNEYGSIIRMLVEHGAELDESTKDVIENDIGFIEIGRFTRDRLMERLFSKVVVGGICSNGEFHGFLAEGVCDARLLIHVASFAYNELFLEIVEKNAWLK